MEGRLPYLQQAQALLEQIFPLRGLIEFIKTNGLPFPVFRGNGKPFWVLCKRIMRLLHIAEKYFMQKLHKGIAKNEK